MAPPPGGDGEAEKIPFRWLDAARYAAASVVAVLIIIVIVKATRVVLVPGSLYVSVVQGSIFFTPSVMLSHPALSFDLNLRIDNPRRRARMYYVNVTTYLFDNNNMLPSSPDPEFDSIYYYTRQADHVVEQQSEAYYPLIMKATNASMPEFFDWLYSNDSASMSGVTMRLDAILVTETTSGSNTSRPVIYYCWPLAILRKPGETDATGDLGDDVFCRDMRGRSRFI